MDASCNEISVIKELMNADPAAAAATIQKYLDEQSNAPLNIGITGESGSGKSTFVNYFRGIKNKSEGAALTGVVETTMEIKSYPHPNYPNVVLWDLPGVGTMKFPAAAYLKKVEFERFDFFIIISADRFRENDVKLAKEIQKMGKKFYFVRSKIDHNLRDEAENQEDFNEKETLEQIKKNCIQGLKDEGFESPQVFLLASPKLHLYDFPLLHQTLEKELPKHKRHALLMAMPNINLDVINKKKDAFKAQIKYCAALSAVGAAVPIPGVSAAADLTLITTTVTKYLDSFGLDVSSLKRLSDTTGVPVNDLKSVIKSPLAATKITKELILNIISKLVIEVATMALEEGSRFIPVFGIPLAMGLSFTLTYKILSDFLNSLADDAQSVFRRSMGLNTSV